MKWNLVNQSLCQIWGVTPARELALRQNGIMHPGVFLESRFLPVSASGKEKVRCSVARAMAFQRLDAVDALVNMFPSGHKVRVVHDCLSEGRACFLDIETDAPTRSAKISCISVLLNGSMQTFVRGKNLLDFLDVWYGCKLIVTFNGKRFDEPVIRKEFGLSCSPAHVDLMEEGRHYGLRGGLKAIETVLGFKRAADTRMTGLAAVDLWREYSKSGSKEVLGRLLDYNREDVRSLQYMYEYILRLSCENRMFAFDL